MAALHRSYVLEDGVRLVSVTVNPEYDSPEILKAYAKKWNADTSRWQFLTGNRGAITDLLVHNFKLGDMEEPIFHSEKFVLADRRGQVRGYYDGTNPEDINKLFKHIAKLLREQ
jgi:protein SCO1/2